MNGYTLLGAQLVSFRNVWNSKTYRHILPMLILNKRDVTVKNIQYHFIQGKWRQTLIRWMSRYNLLQLLYLHHHTSRLTYLTKKVTAYKNNYTTQTTTIKNLRSGYRYYFKVRAVYKDEATGAYYYGNWSNARSVVVK